MAFRAWAHERVSLNSQWLVLRIGDTNFLHFHQFPPVHAMRDMFQTADCEATLLVDASNAFNSINHKAALHNISILCPALSTVLRNTYSATVRLFVVGEGEIPSTEGTTQGDPLTMAMYALEVICVPLIRQLCAAIPDARQAWFADDATAVGSLSSLLR